MYSIFVGTRTNRGNRRYWYNRMPFGIASGPEEYQLREHEFLDGLRGVINIADDICMYGCGNTKKDADIDHDRNLVQLLEKCAEHDLRLSAKNLQFKSPSVTFMGKSLPIKGRSPAIRKMLVPTDKASVHRFLGVILGDPGADKGGEGKSKRVEKYIWNEEK